MIRSKTLPIYPGKKKRLTKSSSVTARQAKFHNTHSSEPACLFFASRVVKLIVVYGKRPQNNILIQSIVP